MKDRLIGAGLGFFRATALDRVASFLTRGRGVVLMFHNVRSASKRAYAPNQPLEVTPEFFETSLDLLNSLEYDVISIDELPGRLSGGNGRRFAVLTFDDGYRDNLEIAAPIMQRRNVPYAIYVTTGFVERKARLWWLELEAAVGALDRIEIEDTRGRFVAQSRTPAEKNQAYLGAYAFLRGLDESAMRDRIASLIVDAGVDANFAELCMTWDEIRAAASDPLCTIGAHTLTHARLAKHDHEVVRNELSESRQIIEREIGRSVLHLAYPFGDDLSAGPREFAIARECGYETALTTRPGTLFCEHRNHLMALPRLAVHGGWQDVRSLEALLTGAPFAVWNLGRRINVS